MTLALGRMVSWFLSNVLFNPRVWIGVGIVLALWFGYSTVLNHGRKLQAADDAVTTAALTKSYNAETVRITDQWNKRITSAQSALSAEQQRNAEISAKYQTANQSAQDLFNENKRLRSDQYAIAMQLSNLSPARPANYPSGGVSGLNTPNATSAPTSSMYCSGAFLFKEDKQLLSGFANDSDTVVDDDLHVRAMYTNLSAAVTATNQSIVTQCAAAQAAGDPFASKVCTALASVNTIDVPAPLPVVAP